MLDTSHPDFPPPPGNPTLWRYTGLAKFIDLLERRQLQFPRSDRFADPFEGVLPRLTVERLKATSSPDVRRLYDDLRRMMYISCWFASEHESAAMWQLYSQGGDCIALRTNLATLSRCLTIAPFTSRICEVRYIDYENHELPSLNGLVPFVHKRLSFQHENEVRAFIWSAEHSNAGLIKPDAERVAVDIDPAVLIRGAHIAPTAKPWFGELVERLLQRYAVPCSVTRSSLYDRPAY
jgi:hypothetical protein